METCRLGVRVLGSRELRDTGSKLRKHLRHIRGPAAKFVRQVVGRPVPNERPQRLHPRPVRRRSGILPATAPEHSIAERRGAGRQLVGEAALADAGLATDQHGAAMARARFIEQAQQLAQLSLAAYELTSTLGLDHSLLLDRAVSIPIARSNREAEHSAVHP